MNPITTVNQQNVNPEWWDEVESYQYEVKYREISLFVVFVTLAIKMMHVAKVFVQ